MLCYDMVLVEGPNGMSTQRAARTRRSAPQDSPEAGRGHVLVVEDEADLRELLRYSLEREGYRVSMFASGEKALEHALGEAPDLILLDLMLPGLDGLTVCTELRRAPQTASVPIIMLTAKGEETDIVVGLQVGADDYVTKPFSPRVLLARISAVLRRQKEKIHADDEPDPADSVIRRGRMILDGARHRTTIDDEDVELTHKEFKALQLLAGRPGRVFTRQQIIAGVHGPDVVLTHRSVDVMVVSLRRKLGDQQAWIQTVRGVGYRFKE